MLMRKRKRTYGPKKSKKTRTFARKKASPISIGSQALTRVVTSFRGDVTVASTVATSSLKINSSFDPMGDRAANQPIGFDQYAAMYGSYMVLNGYVDLSLTNANAFPIEMVTYISTAAVNSTWNVMMSMPGVIHRICGPSTSSGFVAYRHPFNISRALGRAQQLSSSGEDSALVTADPSTLVYLHIVLIGTANLAAATNLSVKCVQRVKFFDRKIMVDA